MGAVDARCEFNHFDVTNPKEIITSDNLIETKRKLSVGENGCDVLYIIMMNIRKY